MSEESRGDSQLDAVAKFRALLCEDIDRFDIESSKHKRIHRRADGLLTILAAATTIVAGLGLVLEGYERRIQFAVLVISAVSAAVAGWAESRRARDLWQHEREAYYALKDILREIDFRCSLKSLEPAEIEELFQRTNAVLGSSTAKWSRILEKKLPQPPVTAPEKR